MSANQNVAKDAVEEKKMVKYNQNQNGDQVRQSRPRIRSTQEKGGDSRAALKSSKLAGLFSSSSSSSSRSSSSNSNSSSNSSSSSSNSSSGSSSVDGSPESFVSVSASKWTASPEIEENACGVDTASETNLPQSGTAEPQDIEARLDQVVDQVEKYCKDKYQDRLTAEFKTELPTITNNFVDGLERFLRMPQFMPVEPEAYEAQTFQNALRPEDLKDRESRDAFVAKLKTTVRWRECQDKSTGALYKESNARIVRWSDGSETFHVGGEAFDVVKHPMPLGQNQLYVRQGSYYHMQGSIKEKMTLRPKLESNFGQSHVQGLRKRAFYKPLNSCVKVLMDLSTNPVLDRERKVKEEQAQERKEKSDKRREQKNQRKPRVKPMRHCTADDTDMEMPMQAIELEEQDQNTGINPGALAEVKRAPGIRTNRNTDIKPTKYEEDSDDDYEEEEQLENEASVSISNGNCEEQTKSKQNKPKYKRKQVIFSDSE